MILMCGMRLLEPGHLSASIVPLQSSLSMMNHNVELVAGANAGPLWIGLCDSGGDCDVVPEGSLLSIPMEAQERRTLSYPG